MTPREEIADLAEIQIEIEVELDRRIMTVREILTLDEGSIFRMTRSAGEHIDILVRGRVVGFGEMVVTDNTMGVRITGFRGAE